MKKFIPLLLSLLILSGCSTQSAANGYQQITMDQAVSLMEEESGYIILDVRTSEEYNEKHIPGAVNIPNEAIGTDELSQLPDKEQDFLPPQDDCITKGVHPVLSQHIFHLGEPHAD